MHACSHGGIGVVLTNRPTAGPASVGPGQRGHDMCIRPGLFLQRQNLSKRSAHSGDSKVLSSIRLGAYFTRIVFDHVWPRR